jgi:hypothetical protein
MVHVLEISQLCYHYKQKTPDNHDGHAHIQYCCITAYILMLQLVTCNASPSLSHLDTSITPTVAPLHRLS